MIRFPSLLVALVVVGICCNGEAQDCAGDRGTGTTKHSYFAALGCPELESLLRNVENHHLNNCPYKSEPAGVPGLIRKGKLEYAIDELNYVLERFVNHPSALMFLNLAAKLLKRPSLPIPYYENALRLYPEYAITHAQYGEYLTGIGKIEEGIKELKMGIEIDPKLAVAYDWLSKAYNKMGNQELARQAAEKAIGLGLKTGQ